MHVYVHDKKKNRLLIVVAITDKSALLRALLSEQMIQGSGTERLRAINEIICNTSRMTI